MSTDPDDLRRALAIAAELVERDGEGWIPHFLRLEAEVGALDTREDTLARARRIAAARRSDVSGGAEGNRLERG